MQRSAPNKLPTRTESELTRQALGDTWKHARARVAEAQTIKLKAARLREASRALRARIRALLAPQHQGQGVLSGFAPIGPFGRPE
jgi:hypothetical protein